MQVSLNHKDIFIYIFIASTDMCKKSKTPKMIYLMMYLYYCQTAEYVKIQIESITVTIFVSTLVVEATLQCLQQIKN